jgi:hypothetical protein
MTPDKELILNTLHTFAIFAIAAAASRLIFGEYNAEAAWTTLLLVGLRFA